MTTIQWHEKVERSEGRENELMEELRINQPYITEIAAVPHPSEVVQTCPRKLVAVNILPGCHSVIPDIVPKCSLRRSLPTRSCLRSFKGLVNERTFN